MIWEVKVKGNQRKENNKTTYMYVCSTYLLFEAHSPSLDGTGYSVRSLSHSGH